MRKFLTLTLLLGLSAPGFAQPSSGTPGVTFTPLPSAPAPTVQLPATAELNKTVSLTVPLGGLTLEQALTGIGRAAGLSVLTQGLPTVTIRNSIAPMPARQAISTLINLYAPDTTAAVMGKVLLVGTSQAIARVQGKLTLNTNPVFPESTYRILTLPGFTAAHLDRVTGFIPRTRVALFDDGVVLLSGAPADVAEAERFLLGLPSPKTAEVAVTPTPTPAPAPITRTYTVTADPAALATAVREITGATVTAVGETLVVKGTEGQQADVRTILAALPPVKPPAPVAPVAVTPAVDTNPVSRRTYTTPLPDADATYLRALFGDITVTPLGDQGVLVVEARASRHTDVTVALKDTAARRAGRVTTYYPVSTGKAADLVAVLKREAPDAEINTVDGRNMLAIRTTPTEQVKLSELIRTLQSGPVLNAQVPTETITRSVKLGYADAALIAADLGRLTLNSTAGSTETVPGASATEGGKQAGNVTIIADARTNSLLLTGPRAQVMEMVSAINLIDVPVQSVRVRLRVEQVSASDAQNLGVNWRLGLGGVSVGQQNGTLSVGYAPSLAPASINVALDAAKSKGNSRTIIDSHFAALSGQDTQFQNGGELLFPATTSGSGQNATVVPGQTYSYGLQIKVRPRIAPDGTIVMTMDTNLGSTPSNGPMGSVQQSKQTLTTSVVIKPGETVVLGGIVTDTNDQSRRGVPGLSSIPVIGALFGTSQASVSQNALLFIVTAEPVAPQRASTAPVSIPAPSVTPAPTAPATVTVSAPAPTPAAVTPQPAPTTPAPTTPTTPNDRGTESVDIPAPGGN